MGCFLLLCDNQKVREKKRGKTKAAASSAKIEEEKKKKPSPIVFSWIHSSAAHRFFMSHPSDSLVFCHLPQLAAFSVQLPKRKSKKKKKTVPLERPQHFPLGDSVFKSMLKI